MDPKPSCPGHPPTAVPVRQLLSWRCVAMGGHQGEIVVPPAARGPQHWLSSGPIWVWIWLIPLVTPQAELWVLAYSTLWQYWPSILLKGPSCWGRCIHLKCIHLTSALPGDHDVVSGMQPNCEVAVFINGPLALADEIPFFLSVSVVILILGNANAFLFPKYFQKVLQLCLMSKPLSLTGNE